MGYGEKKIKWQGEAVPDLLFHDKKIRPAVTCAFTSRK